MKTLLFTLSLLIFSHSFAQVDPNIDWKVIEDSHARWIYDSRHKDLILQYRKNFRKAFPRLKKMFLEVPDKTTFVISDHTDMPNGSATVLPYPLINLFPVIPIPTSGIGETNDSFFEILVHEYTHILNLYPVHGGMRILNAIFGSIVHPNMLLPRWYLEGLAVYSESYFNPKGGRLRSQNFEGMVRAISLNNSWHKYTLDKINDPKPDWVGGQRPYLLGGALMHNIFTSNGNKEIHGLNQRYSKRLPYIINGPLKDFNKIGYSRTLDQTYGQLLEKAKNQQKLIRASPITQGQQVPEQGYNSYRPRVSPDGSLLSFISRQHNVRSALYLVKRTANNDFLSPPIELVSGDGITHIAWSADSHLLVYNKIETHKRYYKYSDLFTYNVKTKKHQRQTHGARVSGITYTSDSTKIFFIQNKTGHKQIAQLDLSTKATSTLYKPASLGTTIYGLTAQGSKLLFVEKTPSQQWLKQIDTAAGGVPTVISKIEGMTSLLLTTKGLLFSSKQSGVDNLYLVKNFAPSTQWQAEPVTNSLTRIIDGDFDPTTGDLYYAELTSEGGKIHKTSSESLSKITKIPSIPPLLVIPTLPEHPTKNSVLPATKSTDQQSNRYTFKRDVAQTNSTGEDTVTEESFYPFRYLIPRYWIPFGYIIDGGSGYSATTTASDPLSKNTYTLGLEWDTLTKELGGSFSYINRSTPITIALGAHDLFRYNRANKSVLEVSGGQLGLRSFIPYLSNNWRWGTTYSYSNTAFTSRDISRSGPSVNLTYQNATKRGYEISPESGGSFSLNHQMYLEEAGDVGYEKTNMNMKYYFSKWLPKRHVLYSQINGTMAPELNDRDLRITSFFTDTIGGNFVSNSLIQPFLVRGYTSGDLIGYNMVSANLEYRFPIWYAYRGLGRSFPVFLKQIHGSIIADGVTLDGLRYSQLAQGYQISDFGQDWYLGTGAEINFDCTIGFYIPITFTFGVYYGADSDISANDVSTFFSFRM